MLGVYLTANPDDMEANFDEKIEEIDSLLRRWSFRNMTVFGRVSLVKSLALSKLTHIVQVIPNPKKEKINKLQKMINSFIWTGSHCSKVVVRGEISEQPMEQGGLAIPNVTTFWNSLKAVWINRLVAAPEKCKWARVCMQQTGRALNKSNFTLSDLLLTGVTQLAESSSSRLQNSFWKNVWSTLPSAEKIYYSVNRNIQTEMLIWGTESIQFNGKPLNKKDFARPSTEKFTCIGDLLNPATGLPWQESDPFVAELSEREANDWQKIMKAVTDFLTRNHLSWYHIIAQVPLPKHLGWSRLACNGTRSRFFYNLLQSYAKPATRNSNERAWIDLGLSHMTDSRWDAVYKNFSRLRTNYRVKFQEFRIIWARQELRKYRLLYHREGDEDPFCSYCKCEIESELHLYVNCGQMQNFWEQAAKWYEILIGINPPLGLKVYRLFGQEKERPDDLNNIFYRTVRYAIFISRKYALGPTLEALEELLLDEFDRKYRRDRWKKYEKDPYEYKAIMFLKRKRGLHHINPYWLPSTT